ncbi:hypothetical protein H0H92_005228 [Tricholoma furcatifolium]|nr:hypothetical protein H0H92_005228 [Tricholoma furcatifolium]
MPSIPWPWRSESPSTKNDIQQPIHDFHDLHDLPQVLESRINTIPPAVLALTSFGFGIVTASASAFVYARYGRRMRNSNWVSPDVLANRRWVKELKDQTLHIRIAGVDAPEGAHFGRPAQPYSAESLAWLQNYIHRKTVYCQLIRRDQYSRIVANVTLSPRILPGSFVTGKNLSLEMLRAGWGTVYAQAGAEYGKAGKEEFLRVEAEAKSARRGMWEKGVGAETPAEYKRRHASAASLEEAEAARPKTASKRESKRKSWIRRLLSR